MGQITNDAASVFSQKLVDELMERPLWQLKTPPKFIFLGVDPYVTSYISFSTIIDI